MEPPHLHAQWERLPPFPLPLPAGLPNALTGNPKHANLARGSDLVFTRAQEGLVLENEEKEPSAAIFRAPYTSLLTHT